MLSDEENKMLEIFKKEVEKEQNEYEQVNEYTKFYYNNHKFILNLIEKQSKEIEELKEKDDANLAYYDQIYQNGIYTGQKAVEYKIKAKIEELDKEEKEALKGTKGQDRYAIKQEYMYKRSGLESLLEKE